jgi:glycosyltransferase involved in cell wall biosynthesis
VPEAVAAGRRTRVLVVTLDTIAPAMAGPAIRAWEICTALSQDCDVALVTFGACRRPGTGFDVRHVDVAGFRAEVDQVDVLVVQGFVVHTFAWLADVPQCIVVDLYDPFQLETLEVDRYRPDSIRWEALDRARGELSAQLARGDLFLCASRRQRDLWLGALSAAGRVNPATYDDDPTMASLLALVPFGLDPHPPARREPAIRGVVPGIDDSSKVLLWGGGVYNWFDPLTLVRAVDRLHREDPDVRLFFLGMQHPTPDVPEMAMATRTRELADELGLTGSVVFFNERWVDYDRRADYLLDADVGVSCHFPHVETEFSFRTRILDYLWAGLPVVCTGGDAFAEHIEAAGAGLVVPAEDVDSLVEALRQALDPVQRPLLAAGSRSLAIGFTWGRVLEPLVAYCLQPRRAADHGLLEPNLRPGRSRIARLADDLRAAWRHLRDGGPTAVWRKVRWRLARRAAER